MEEAARECKAIRADYDEKAKDEYWRVVQAGVKEAEQRVQRLDRTARLEAKKSILSMKQEVVSEAFELARKKILGLPESEYVAFLARQCAQAASTGQEEILMNESERTRFGAKVVKSANELLRKRALPAQLTLGTETRNISGGLFLKQGGHRSQLYGRYPFGSQPRRTCLAGGRSAVFMTPFTPKKGKRFAKG